MKQLIRWVVGFTAFYLVVMILRGESHGFMLSDKTIAELQAETCKDILNTSTFASSISSSSQKQSAQDLFNFASNSYPDFQIQLAAEGKNTDPLIKGAIQVTAPWVILLLVSIFGFIGSIMSCTCECCCPPSKCCRKPHDIAYTDPQLQIPLCFLVLLCIVVVAVAIPGIIYSATVADGLRSTRCSLFSSVGDLTLDKGGAVWIGLDQLAIKFSSLADQVEAFGQQTKNTFKSDTNEYYKNLTSLQQQNQQLSQTSNDNSYFQKNGALNYICCADAKIDPYVLNEAMNAVTPQSVYFDSFYKFMIDTITQLTKAGQTIGNDTKSFVKQIKTGAKSINSTRQDITKSSNNAYQNSQTADFILKYITLGAQILYGFSLFLATMGVIGAFLLGTFKKYWARYLLHCMWCSYGIIMIVGFILVMILFPLNGVMMQGCLYINGLLTVRQNMNDQQFLSGKIKDIMLECLYDDGNILNTFKMTKQINQVRNLSDQLNQFSQNVSNFVARLETDDVKIQEGNLQFFNDFLQYKRVDSKPSDGLDPTNAFYRMANFSQGAESCSHQDALSPNRTLCPTDLQSNFITVTDGIDNNVLTPACVSSQFFYQQNYGTLQTRYSGCAPQTEKLTTLAASFQTQSLNWLAPNTSEQRIMDQHKINTKELVKKINSINEYIKKTNSFIIEVVGQQATETQQAKEGIIQSINCKFLTSTSQTFYDSVCVNSVPPLYVMQILLAIMCVGMLMGSCLGCCSALRYSHNQRIGYNLEKLNEEKVDQEEAQQNTTAGKYVIPDYQQIPQVAQPTIANGTSYPQQNQPYNQQQQYQYPPAPL